MAIAMFHMKHQAKPGKQVSRAGLDRARAAPVRAGTGLQQASTVAVLGMVLAACSSPQAMAEGANISQTAAPAMPAAPPASATEAVAFTDNAKQGEAGREFSYAWPAEVSAVPALTQRLTAEREKLLAEQKADWDESLRAFAGSDCAGCVNRSFEKTWEVVADLPRFLSLSASFYAYTGGAHGNGAYDALVWDREARAAFDPKALFRSPEALQSALGAAWCKALKTERQKRLGPDYSDDGFFQCPPVADLTVLVGSSDSQAFNRIGLLAAPYVAGSYAEGTYEVTLPVTPAVLAAVRPEYRAAFALAK
jgi:hypothetical protein